MEYEIVIGDILDLKYGSYMNIAGVCSCLTIRDGRTRMNVPFIALDIKDDEPITPEQFDKGIAFIEHYIPNGNVMVACEEGRCRSVSVAIAYYMSTGMNYVEAAQRVGRYPSCSIHRDSLINYVDNNGFEF